MSYRIRLLRHIVALTLRADRRRALAIAGLVVLLAGVTAATAASQRWLVDSAATGTVVGLLLAAALGLVAHAGATAGWTLQFNLRLDLTHRVDLDLRNEILSTAATIPTIGHLERPAYLDRITSLRNGTNALAASCWSVAETIAAFVSLGLSVWLLADVHPVLAGAALLALPPLYLADRGRVLIQRSVDETAELERAEGDLHQLCIDPAAAKEVRISDSGARISEQADELWARALRRRASARVAATALQAGGWLGYVCGMVAALTVVSTLVLDGRATIGDIILVIALASQLQLQIDTVAGGIATLGRAGHAVSHYRWLMAYAEQHRTQAISPPPDRLGRGITLRGVAFRYPGTDRDVVAGLDLHLPAGGTVALVGINGAGKSTVVKLLAALYHPTEGWIEVDGLPLRQLDPDAWRARITGTFQDFVKFNLTAREAVGVGDLPHIDDRERVSRAVSSAGAGPVVDGLPDGMQTLLGRVFDGVELSHGQWQRLALARGHMRPEPLLVLLDEPSAALDPEAEHELYERYHQQAAATAARCGTVTVLVSHRFSTVRMADLIVVLDGGRVAETGNHDELMAAGGDYARHFRAQAQGYADQPTPER